jgi:tRNA threonylcarbamoyladenosine biosynthesis protein TsaB
LSVLFIDSSYDITLGLLDEGMEWLDFRIFRGQRASSTLQTETHKLLKDFQKQMSDLKRVVTIAGPGFYTGLRLSEGFSDVTSFFNIPHNSFYTYEIPFMTGVQEGMWVTKAYRGEYFIYEWKGHEGKGKLLEAKDLSVPHAQVFIHSEISLDEKLRPLTTSAVSTLDLLKKHPKLIFNKVLGQDLKRESYYFRAPEDEFRMNP